MASEKRIGVLISGRGSNMRAIVRACRGGEVPGRVVLVLSNRPEAAGVAWARSEGLDVVVVPHRAFSSRAAHEEAVIRELEARGVEWICLAGYMRLLSPDFVSRFRWRILNIHPSLLPAFPGLDAQRQALEYGVKVAGCTVHFVDEKVDHGPIVVQKAVPVLDDDDVESLAARILEQEHLAYPEALRLLFTRRWRIEGRRVLFL